MPTAPMLARDFGQRFTPGTLLLGRYRIVGLLGRGGMGEVYRADDLKLGAPVALKFLPGVLANDHHARERFLQEVRLARQIAHPNVCRVFDIGETTDERQYFLSMEYVDGEDLASLLRRIGRLPPDKALDIARQICAGLAAAHDRGVLHRDLKPANVMLDGRGRVRITDFGLAVAADAAERGVYVAGTPLYMAPEQLAGKSPSVQTDIYSLGMVLFELYTGKRPFNATSLAELRAQKEQPPPAPSESISDMDPVVDRVILRTMAGDPRARPTSMTHVLKALPGGNLLQELLRAGETPSPDMVAASGTSEGIEPRIGWALLALVVAGAVVAAVLGSGALLWRRHAPEKSPEVLANHARQTLASLGYVERPVDHASGYAADLDQLRYMQSRDPVRWRSVTSDPSFIRFWYRESPRPLEALRFPYQYGNVARVAPDDPPLDTAGMTLVRVDSSGRLTQLVVVPPSASLHEPATIEPDWAALLTRAGFDPSAWQPSAPQRNPPTYADTRAAWTGTWPNTPDLPVRLEAATFRGKPVYFEAVYPWTPPPRTPPTTLTRTERSGVVIGLFLIAATIVGAAIFAQRNLRAGRGDRRGAFRLSAFVFAAMFVSWFFGERHVATMWEFVLLAMALGGSLLAAAFCWLAYLAVEPLLRRRWPEVLVTWTRVLAGEFRDPLVGRDVLIGCAAGALLAVVAMLGFLVPQRIGIGSNLVFADVYGVVYGLQSVVPLLLWRAAQAVLAGLACVFLLLMLRLALRSQWAAVATFVLANAAISGASVGPFWIGFSETLIHVGVYILLLVRFGLLASVVQFYVWGLFIFFPLTTDLTAWYAGAGVTALLVLALLTLFGFTTARGGRSASDRARLEA